MANLQWQNENRMHSNQNQIWADDLPKFNVTLMMLRDIVESVILLKDDACKGENKKTNWNGSCIFNEKKCGVEPASTV